MVRESVCIGRVRHDPDLTNRHRLDSTDIRCEYGYFSLRRSLVRDPVRGSRMERYDLNFTGWHHLDLSNIRDNNSSQWHCLVREPVRSSGFRWYDPYIAQRYRLDTSNVRDSVQPERCNVVREPVRNSWVCRHDPHLSERDDVDISTDRNNDQFQCSNLVREQVRCRRGLRRDLHVIYRHRLDSASLGYFGLSARHCLVWDAVRGSRQYDHDFTRRRDLDTAAY
jgi:hypothetical protein